MGKTFIFAGVLAFSTQLLSAQSVLVKGTVRLSSGYPVSGVSVKAKQEKRELFTDSSGQFAFKVSPNSTIVVDFPGFDRVNIHVEEKAIDTVITINPTGTVKSDGLAESALDSRTFTTAISSNVGGGGVGMYGHSISPSSTMLPSFSHKEETRGSRYLFDSWRKGTATDKNDTMINIPAYRYNYDKVAGELLMTEDGKTALSVDKTQIKSFTLTGDAEDAVLFRYVPEIDQKLFINVLAEGDNYVFYKQIKTKFVKSDYRSDGMTSTGNPYDEYSDDYIYYIKNVKTKQLTKVSFKNRFLKELMVDQKAKADRYLSDHRDEVIDERFVTGLVEAVNH